MHAIIFSYLRQGSTARDPRTSFSDVALLMLQSRFLKSSSSKPKKMQHPLQWLALTILKDD